MKTDPKIKIMFFRSIYIYCFITGGWILILGIIFIRSKIFPTGSLPLTDPRLQIILGASIFASLICTILGNIYHYLCVFRSSIQELSAEKLVIKRKTTFGHVTYEILKSEVRVVFINQVRPKIDYTTYAFILVRYRPSKGSFGLDRIVTYALVDTRKIQQKLNFPFFEGLPLSSNLQK